MFCLKQFVEFGKPLLKVTVYMAPVALLNRELSNIQALCYPKLWRRARREMYLEYGNTQSTHVACK